MIIQIFSILCALVINSNAATDNIVCFYATWAVYRPGNGSFLGSNLNNTVCTHVVYAFLGVDYDGSLKMLDPTYDVVALGDVQVLKIDNPDLKVLVSIGGYNAGPEFLTGIIASSKLRANLIQSSLAFFEEWGYDGLDVDWEYPTNVESINFGKLLEEMKTAFAEKGYLLSVTVPGFVTEGYVVPTISQAADLLNVMTYDFTVPAMNITGHNAPLYGSSSVDSSIREWTAAGADASKITLGVPFYGHSYALTTLENNHVGDQAVVGISGPYTRTPGSLGYMEICEFYFDWHREWDEEAQVPYMYDNMNWISYDNNVSISLKAQYAKENGLAGVMVWSVDTDDFRGNCDGEPFRLLRIIKDSFSG